MKNEKKYTLLDAVILGGAKDIVDDVYDCMNYFECATDSAELKDDYDRVQYWIGQGVEVIKANKDIIICKLSEFIEDNRAIFDTFLNLIYKTQYQPQNNRYIDFGDEEFYDFYIAAFFDILNGGISNKDYGLLWRLINNEKGVVGYIVKETQTRLDNGERSVFFYGADDYIHDYQDEPTPYKTKSGAIKRIERETATCEKQGENTYILRDTWKCKFKVLQVPANQ